jgi:hypothetical protein
MSDSDNGINVKVYKYIGVLKKHILNIEEAERIIASYSEKYPHMMFHLYIGDSDNIEVDWSEAEDDTLEILEDSKIQFEKEFLDR